MHEHLDRLAHQPLLPSRVGVPERVRHQQRAHARLQVPAARGERAGHLVDQRVGIREHWTQPGVCPNVTRMRTNRLVSALALAAVLPVAPAGATGPATLPYESTWRPWTRLLDENPYRIPAAAGQLRGIVSTSRCGGADVGLATAVARLGAALHVDDALAPDVRLAPETERYLARLTDCLATHVPHLPAYDGERLGPAPDALRAQWLGTMTDLLALVEQPPALPPAGTRASCVDVLCLVQTGGTGSDTYSSNAALIVDQGGADVYRNNAGGASPLGNGVPAALLLDLGTSNDSYLPEQTDAYGFPTNGSGYQGGVGVLVDQGGDDHYCGLGGTMGAAFSGGGLLLDLAGSDYYESFSPDTVNTSCPWNPGSNYGQSHKLDHGAAVYGGWGFLVDGGGDDDYVNHGVDSVGYGAAGGTGLLVDVSSGRDTYHVFPAWTGCGVGSCDVYNSGVSVGVGEVGGTGVLLDGGGNDSYGCFEGVIYGCQGAAAVGVLGLLYDAGGSDTHYLGWAAGEALLAGGLRGTGLGVGELGGVGVFVDQSGNDGDTSEDYPAVGYGGDAGAGVFLDLGGTDAYSVPGSPTAGTRGNGGTWAGGYGGAGIDLPL